MSDDNWGAAEPIRQSIKDLMSKITSHFGSNPPATQQDAPAQHADPGMVNEANESFRKAAEKMKSEGHTYDSNRPQVQVRSRYTK